jgi:hypothetical protein
MEVQKQAGGSTASTNGGSLIEFAQEPLQQASTDYEVML